MNLCLKICVHASMSYVQYDQVHHINDGAPHMILYALTLNHIIKLVVSKCTKQEGDGIQYCDHTPVKHPNQSFLKGLEAT